LSVITTVEEVAPEVTRIRHLFVNAYLIGRPDNWILVDAALAGAATAIIEAAEAEFGPSAVPKAILLTHGHFDHVGALPALLDHWDVPVWAHPLEVPHLTGTEDYPPPDPSVGKGAMALLSFAYPSKAIDLGERVRALPLDSQVPNLPEWKWIHTPGHTQGHISLYRASDGLLVAGDAFVTVEQESLYNVLTQKEEVHGPPAYFTPDWAAAEESVRTLQALHPHMAATGHGQIMEGEALEQGLARLVEHFSEVAVPDQGRYVDTA
jgi:glyoxylase-like metal-dependent hydrolase (beta-lactamase superfamily II)